MQSFKCHKIVTAARIVGMVLPSFGLRFGTLTLEGHETCPVPLPREWAVKHNPSIGGYLVQYRDGYSSYSPADAFENGYHFLDNGLHTAHVEPVWPLRTSAKAEQPPELAAIEPAVVPGLKIITKLPRADEVESYPSLQIRCDDPGSTYGVVFIVTPDWFRATKPELGGGLVAVEGGDPIYYPPASYEPALPTRVTSQALEAMFRDVAYEIRPDGRTTVCEITFKNGFTLRGESSAACVENFRRDLGEQYALKEAMDKAWGYAGFLLMEDRYRAGL